MQPVSRTILIVLIVGLNPLWGSDRNAASRLGVTHVGGTYHLTDEPFLMEGARKIRDTGFRVIKLYMYTPPANNSYLKSYPFNSHWRTVHTLVELANTAEYRSVFGMNFDAYILTVYSSGRFEHYWRDGISDEQAEDETRQFHDLTAHLMTTYQGTGKTFVLSHWEGDWAIRTSFNAKVNPTQTAIDGMIRWLAARQAGVDQARHELTVSGVRVFHAAEVNRVKDGMVLNRPCVTNRVLPHVDLDLVSYSSWDTQDDPVLFRRALDYIAKNARHRPPFNEQNVYIGEFGKPENQFSEERVAHTLNGVIDTATDWGCPYIVFWQLYCNEARHKPVTNNDDVRGFWLFRPDGTRSWAWRILNDRLHSADSLPADR